MCCGISALINVLLYQKNIFVCKTEKFATLKRRKQGELLLAYHFYFMGIFNRLFCKHN